MRMFGEVSSCDAGTRTSHRIDSRIDPIVQAAERRSGSFRDRRADGHTRDRSTLALAIQGCASGDCVLSRPMRTFTASSFWRFRGLHRPNVAAGETLKRVDAVGRARKFQPTRMGLAALLAGHIGSRLHRLASGGRRRTSFNTASGGVGLTRTASAPAARARSKSASRVFVVTTRIGTVRVVSSRRSTSQSAYPSTIGRRVSVITSVAWTTVVS